MCAVIAGPAIANDAAAPAATVAFILDDLSSVQPLQTTASNVPVIVTGAPLEGKAPPYAPDRHGAPLAPLISRDAPANDMDDVIDAKWRAFDQHATDRFFKARQD